MNLVGLESGITGCCDGHTEIHIHDLPGEAPSLGVYVAPFDGLDI